MKRVNHPPPIRDQIEEYLVKTREVSQKVGRVLDREDLGDEILDEVEKVVKTMEESISNLETALSEFTRPRPQGAQESKSIDS